MFWLDLQNLLKENQSGLILVILISLDPNFDYSLKRLLVLRFCHFCRISEISEVSLLFLRDHYEHSEVSGNFSFLMNGYKSSKNSNLFIYLMLFSVS